MQRKGSAPPRLSETDSTEDLKKFDVPTLLLHGEDDQVVPVADTARKSEKLIRDVKAIYYSGAPHGITASHIDQLNADLLAFLEMGRKTSIMKETKKPGVGAAVFCERLADDGWPEDAGWWPLDRYTAPLVKSSRERVQGVRWLSSIARTACIVF